VNVNRIRKKYLKIYNREASDEDVIPANSIVIITFGAIFISIILGTLTQKIIKPVTINPFLLMAVVFAPSLALVYLVFLAMRYFNLRIFSDRYSFATIYTDIKDVPVQRVNNFNGQNIDFSIIPLGGAVIRDFPPLRGGGRQGFLVVDRRHARNLGGGIIFITSELIRTRVEALPPELRERIKNHPLYKPKAPIYFGVLEKRINGLTIDEYMESVKPRLIRDFWAMRDSASIFKERHEADLAKYKSRVTDLEERIVK